MNRGTAWSVHAAAAAVGGTGIVYAWMRWIAEPADEFALVNHPLEPDLRAWHIVLAPALVFAVGVLWRGHVWGRIRAGMRERRRTGIVLAVLFGPCVASGYLLQVAEDPDLRALWVWVHGTTSFAWGLVYVLHQLGRRSAAGRRAGRRGAAAAARGARGV